MSNLRTAAQQALEAMESAEVDPHSSDAVYKAITALRAALAEPTVKESLQVESAVAEIATTQQQLDNKPPSDYRRGYWDGFAIGKREGRIEAEDALAEPVQEPVAWSFEARHIDTAFGPAVSIRHPGREHKYMRNVKPLYIAPPQRKPLTETSAERTLKRLGYTDCGGEFWKPPLGAPAEPVQEPVAWRTFDGEGGYDYRTYEDNEDYAAEWAKRNPRHVGWVEPLYAAPPQRKPLTEEEIDGLMQSIGLRCADDGNERMANHAEWERRQRRRIARAIERAHGIGGNDE